MAAREPREALASAAAALIAVLIAAVGSEPDRQRKRRSWSWSNGPFAQHRVGAVRRGAAAGQGQERDRDDRRRPAAAIGVDRCVVSAHRAASASGTVAPSGMWRSRGVADGPSIGSRPSGASRTQPAGSRSPSPPDTASASSARPSGIGPRSTASPAVERDRAEAAARRRAGSRRRGGCRRTCRDDDAPARRPPRAAVRAPVPRSVETIGQGRPAAGRVGHQPVAIEADEEPEIRRVEQPAPDRLRGSMTRVRQATSPHDWTASRSPAEIPGEFGRPRPPEAAVGAPAPPGRGRAGTPPSIGRDQMPRSARVARSTRIS